MTDQGLDVERLARALNATVGTVGWLRLHPGDPVEEWRENARAIAAAYGASPDTDVDDEYCPQHPLNFVNDGHAHEARPDTGELARLREAGQAFIDWYDSPGRSYRRDGSGPAAIAALRAALVQHTEEEA